MSETHAVFLPLDDPALWQSGLVDLIADRSKISPKDLREHGKSIRLPALPANEDQPFEASVEIGSTSLRVELRSSLFTEGQRKEISRFVISSSESTNIIQEFSVDEKPTIFANLQGIRIHSADGGILRSSGEPRDIEEIFKATLPDQNGSTYHGVLIPTDRIPKILRKILSDVGELESFEAHTDAVIFTPKIEVYRDSYYEDKGEHNKTSWIRAGGLVLMCEGRYDFPKLIPGLRVMILSVGDVKPGHGGEADSSIGKIASSFRIASAAFHENAHREALEKVIDGDLDPRFAYEENHSELYAFRRQLEKEEMLLEMLAKLRLQNHKSYKDLQRQILDHKHIIRVLKKRCESGY